KAEEARVDLEQRKNATIDARRLLAARQPRVEAPPPGPIAERALDLAEHRLIVAHERLQAAPRALERARLEIQVGAQDHRLRRQPRAWKQAVQLAEQDARRLVLAFLEHRPGRFEEGVGQPLRILRYLEVEVVGLVVVALLVRDARQGQKRQILER